MRVRILTAALTLALSAAAHAETYELTVENLAPAGGIFLTPVWIGFHSGNFDLFNVGAALSADLERIAEDGNASPLDAGFRAGNSARASVIVTEPGGFAGAPVFEPGSIARATIQLNPAQHRFLSYATMVIPSNDAFVGNDNPQAIQIFGENGQPTGPVSFVVYGRSVWDAGTEVNTETEAAFLNQAADNQGTAENGVVRLHPGLNGSLANPAARPVNILGGSFMGIHFGVTAADFSRAPYPLLRITLAPAGQQVRVRVRNLQPVGGLYFTPFWAGFHNGGFDLYDRGASASNALERLAEDGDTGPLTALFAGNGVDATITEPSGFAGAPVFDPDTVAERVVRVTPASARYFSFASMVIPSNDAFIANGEPRQFPVFAADGSFRPLHLTVSGSMVLDAGTEVNSETAAAFLDQTAANQGSVENAGVRPHLGFNGSVANPTATPVNILGGTNAAGTRIDPQLGDFTRNNPNLVEITVTRLIDASFSGTWFNPQRNGEGYMLDISERNGQLIGVISGFSYAIDGSGRQLWFTGEGPIVDDTLIASLVTTQGGQFQSLANPSSVVRSEFGSARLTLTGCSTGQLTITPRDSGAAVQTIAVERITTPAVGTISACSR